MPMMIQMQGVETIAQEMEVPIEGGGTAKVFALVLHDPQTGISIQTVFADDEAAYDQDGTFRILPKKDSDLLIADASQMPRGPNGGPPIPNGPGGRKRRPGR